MTMSERHEVLFVEPFYGGSHKQLMDLLPREVGGVVVSLPATKWHWRLRVSALQLSDLIPRNSRFRLGICLARCTDDVACTKRIYKVRICFVLRLNYHA